MKDLKSTIHGIGKFMEASNTELKLGEKHKKQLLSMSVVKKNARVDTEKVLYDFLYPKFGQRFLNYRKGDNCRKQYGY